jgi:mycofactocin system FadH/OYE family oxidoreductase 2
MPSIPFSHLFSPVSLGSVTLKNRLYMSPHDTLFADADGLPTQRYIDYIEERARGGVGAISSGMYVVMPNSINFAGAHIAYDERLVPIYRRLTAAIHRHGAVAFCQLSHTGRQTDSSFSRRVNWAPSAVAGMIIREVPKEMDQDEIRQAVAAFAHAAALAKAGGFDGVELHGATGYLIEQFHSPWSNRRADAYGGSLENRMRFVTEIIDAVRDRCGEPFVIGIKLTVQEVVPGGLALEEGTQIAARLAAEKMLAFVHVGDGPYEGLAMRGSGMHQPRGMSVQETAAIKAAVAAARARTAVICNRRISDPFLADEIIGRGQADLVSMARALISDPYLPAKARQGRSEEIRICIACNQECLGRLFFNKPISCIQNPAVGEEARWGEEHIRPGGVAKTVVIVGGGPAGLKAAEIAARRGHRVTLYERAPALGGKALLASRGAHRDEFKHLTEHLIRQVERSGVTVHVNTEVTPPMLARRSPDAVIVATGAEQTRPSFAGSDRPSVMSAEAILTGERPAGGRVVVLDYDGYWQGISTAELLAAEGWKVTLTTPLPAVGMDVAYKGDVTAALRRLYGHGVELVPQAMPISFDGDRLILRHVLAGSQFELDGVSTVVWTGLYQSQNRLYQQLKASGYHAIAIGDCLAPRTASSAIYEGLQAAMEL